MASWDAAIRPKIEAAYDRPVELPNPWQEQTADEETEDLALAAPTTTPDSTTTPTTPRPTETQAVDGIDVESPRDTREEARAERVAAIKQWREDKREARRLAWEDRRQSWEEHREAREVENEERRASRESVEVKRETYTDDTAGTTADGESNTP